MKNRTLLGIIVFFFLYFYYIAPCSERRYRDLTQTFKKQQKKLSSLEEKKYILQNRIFETLNLEEINETKSLLLSEKNLTKKNDILVEISPPNRKVTTNWLFNIYILVAIILIMLTLLFGIKIIKLYFQKNKKNTLISHSFH